nr:class I SAM-dependent methyltransferase [Synechococcus sp. CCY 0621]
MTDWLRKHLAKNRLICSELVEKGQSVDLEMLHQDLCSLTFPDASFDLVLCNEIFEQVRDLDVAFKEIVRVLRPGGQLVATCPMAFGQRQSIIKALPDPNGGAPVFLDIAERHGDPVDSGTVVYRIPGWELIEQLVVAGFCDASIQHISSWKHGILGADLPGILVITANR